VRDALDQAHANVLELTALMQTHVDLTRPGAASGF
jgi:hypothetical protein